MQEEIEHKTVNLAISTTKLSARTLLRGMQFLLRHETSTRFVQFPGRTLMRGMQDMEVQQA